jgi:hypothetical protein
MTAGRFNLLTSSLFAHIAKKHEVSVWCLLAQHMIEAKITQRMGLGHG